MNFTSNTAIFHNHHLAKKGAQETRLKTIDNQLGVCQQMIKIKTGTKEEIQSRRRAEKLLKEKEKVSKDYFLSLDVSQGLLYSLLCAST